MVMSLLDVERASDRGVERAFALRSGYARIVRWGRCSAARGLLGSLLVLGQACSDASTGSPSGAAGAGLVPVAGTGGAQAGGGGLDTAAGADQGGGGAAAPGGTGSGGVGDQANTGGGSDEGGASGGGAGGSPEGGASGEANAGVGGADPATPEGGTSGAGVAGSEAGVGGDSGQEVPGFNPCPSDGSPCRVMPLGDSITQGYGSTGGGYRKELFRLAVEGGKNVTFVGNANDFAPNPPTVAGQPFPTNHEGHGGFTVNQIADLVDASISRHQPHVVLLMIGTNDLNGGQDAQGTAMRLDNLAGRIIQDAPDALLVVASIIPIENGNGGKVQPYNSALADIVDRRAAAGDHILFADNHAAFTSRQDYGPAWMGDTLHPNDDGYVQLGASYYESIGDFLLSTP